MKRRDSITRYVREIAAFVPADVNGRAQALEEIESHLRDSVADHERQGVTSVDAMNRVLDEFGAASAVAAGFSETNSVRGVRGTRRWLPLVLPVASAVVAVFILGSSLARDGLTIGDQLAARWVALWLAFDLVLVGGAYYAIRRADHDGPWRAAAWACTVLLVVVPVLR